MAQAAAPSGGAPPRRPAPRPRARRPAPKLPTGRLGAAIPSVPRPKLPAGKPPAKALPSSVKAKTGGTIVSLPKAIAAIPTVTPAPGSKAWWSEPTTTYPGGKAAFLAGGSTPPPKPTPKPSTPQQQIYAALRGKGLSPIQAAGILGNIQKESSFVTDPGGSAGVPDSGGTRSFGLIQWNTGGIGAGGVGQSLSTGNVAKDFPNQINAIAALARKIGLTNAGPAQAATQWASQVEGCVGCQPGGSQSVARAANAVRIYAQAIAQNWNKYVGNPGSPISAFTPGPASPPAPSAGSSPIGVATAAGGESEGGTVARKVRAALPKFVSPGGPSGPPFSTGAPPTTGGSTPPAFGSGAGISSGSLTGNVINNGLPGFTPTTQTPPTSTGTSVGPWLIGAAVLGGVIYYMAKKQAT